MNCALPAPFMLRMGKQSGEAHRTNVTVRDIVLPPSLPTASSLPRSPSLQVQFLQPVVVRFLLHSTPHQPPLKFFGPKIAMLTGCSSSSISLGINHRRTLWQTDRLLRWLAQLPRLDLLHRRHHPDRRRASHLHVRALPPRLRTPALARLCHLPDLSGYHLRNSTLCQQDPPTYRNDGGDPCVGGVWHIDYYLCVHGGA